MPLGVQFEGGRSLPVGALPVELESSPEFCVSSLPELAPLAVVSAPEPPALVCAPLVELVPSGLLLPAAGVPPLPGVLPPTALEPPTLGAVLKGGEWPVPPPPLAL